MPFEASRFQDLEFLTASRKVSTCIIQRTVGSALPLWMYYTFPVWIKVKAYAFSSCNRYVDCTYSEFENSSDFGMNELSIFWMRPAGETMYTRTDVDGHSDHPRKARGVGTLGFGIRRLLWNEVDNERKPRHYGDILQETDIGGWRTGDPNVSVIAGRRRQVGHIWDLAARTGRT